MDRCSHNSQALIVGGIAAKAKEFMHQALIGFQNGANSDYVCGGSLISERFVLSVAHCSFESDLGYAKFVKLGMISRSDTKFVYNIQERIKHPDYKKPAAYNDIVLFKLDRNVEFNDYILPICLPQTDLKAPKAIATGN